MSVLVALIAWPIFGSGSRAHAAKPVPAAVLPDYLYRDKTVAFYEKRVRRDTQDQISARLLAGQYIQRYRETGDVGDVFRGMAQAQRSITLQPGNSAAAYEILASGNTELHRFSKALALETFAHQDNPYDANALTQMASLNMEMGHYAKAKRIIDEAERKFPNNTGVDSVFARYQELTGNLEDARSRLNTGSIVMDNVIDNSAQARSWYHWRMGEMAFSSGAIDEAKQDERDALSIFPTDWRAFNALARFCWATKDWPCALDAATKGANIIPLPELLGYKADAQAATGDVAGAKQTQQLIFAIERIGNAYRISDRLLSVYYAEHHVRLDDGYRIAQREILVRGDEIYAQDTLAWAAAMDGHWDVARTAMAKALRHNTQDPRLQYHAGIIALHFADKDAAKRYLSAALQLNPQFDPFYADDARKQLASL